MNARTDPLRVSVVGVGHLGSRHAEKLAASPRAELVSVYDRRADTASAVAENLGCPAARTLDEALERAEAVVVATSTVSHRETAGAALEARRHVLVEKPLTGLVADAEALVALAEDRSLVLHVGHVERFNPAVRGLLDLVERPLFIESHRLAPLVPRSLDIDVIQDLMIHDIDLALAFIGKEPTRIDASGAAVLTERVDIANARLGFEGGVTANLTASRVSLDRVRKFRVFSRGTYVSADCVQGRSDVYALRENREDALRDALTRGGPLDMLRVLDHSTVGGEGGDALTAEHDAFIDAIRDGGQAGVTGRQTLGVLRTMVAIEEAVQATLGEA